MFVQRVLTRLRGVEDEVRLSQLALGDALEDQCLAGAGIADDDAVGTVSQVDLFAGAVVAEVDDVSDRVEGHGVDLPHLVGADVDRVRCGSDAALPGQRTGKVLAQMVIDDRGEVVDGQLTQ